MAIVWSSVVRAGVEILILAVAIYYALNLIRRTRGAPVVYGFAAVMLGMTVLAAVLRLEVLWWLLKTFFAFGAIAILVLFQPELRRILARLGTSTLFNPVQEQRENIEIVIQTVERLADVKIGALIAIEQAENLEEAIHSGVVVNCEATPEMLETIFFPNNAIHDGGVLLRGDRIAKAACIFPLTQRSDLNPSLGTRHRAAIGLSEETDAIVVVVSEETGSISYAFDGQLTRGVTVEQLRAFLTSAAMSRASAHPGRRLFKGFFSPATGDGKEGA
jgi:diadenylate cyclase